MNFLSILPLQAAPAQTGASGAGFWIMIVLLFGIMWLFMIRPQRKQQKEMEKFRNELKKGDKIVTVGGIYGTIDEIKEDTVLVKVDGDVKLKMSKTAIQKDYTPNA